MTKKRDDVYQRNALAPGLLAALVLVIGVAALGGGAFTIIQFVVSILALIVAWFAIQARQWWWVPVFLAIAVLWNPVIAISLPESWWIGAHYVAALAFVTAGVLVKLRTPTSR